ncbi:MAG TPA: DNA repair protein RadC [Allosphingosinicella sp.]|jgi:DNA repair protein RadC
MAERSARANAGLATRLAVELASDRLDGFARNAAFDVGFGDVRTTAASGDDRQSRQLCADLLHAAWPDEAERRAARLIAEFGSLPGLLSADPAEISRCLGAGGEAVAAFIATVRGVHLHSLRREVEAGPLLPTSAALLDYLHANMAWSSDEEFRVLYLNSRNRLLRDETIAKGTPNEVTVHPRTIVKRALELSATALILVHNHPSGSTDPSQSDIQTTARIVRAARTLDIVVHDHIIVARTGWRSFRQSGLLS